jgi:hypothetical protein
MRAFNTYCLLHSQQYAAGALTTLCILMAGDILYQPYFTHCYSINHLFTRLCCCIESRDQRDGDDVGDAETMHIHFSNSASFDELVLLHFSFGDTPFLRRRR